MVGALGYVLTVSFPYVPERSQTEVRQVGGGYKMSQTSLPPQPQYRESLEWILSPI
jgi:hypothetical protein